MCPAMLLTRSVGCQGIWIGALSADPAEWGRSRCQTLAATSVKVLSPAARLVESQRCKTHGSDVVDDRPGSCWTAHVAGTAKPTPSRRAAPGAARPGGEFFARPTGPNHRRYEAATCTKACRSRMPQPAPGTPPRRCGHWPGISGPARPGSSSTPDPDRPGRRPRTPPGTRSSNCAGPGIRRRRSPRRWPAPRRR